VGYAGGSKSNPTYHGLGNHSETIQIDYDPTQITYEELLAVFWDNHSPTGRSYSRQYASIIFAHDDEQERLALKTKAREEAGRGQTIYTEIIRFTTFWAAEDYHQKYRLRQNRDLMEEFTAIYPDPNDFVNSSAAARVNGYLGGNGTLAQFEAEIEELGLSVGARQYLEEVAERRLR
jgi:peptide-methionine (S)-S-oxide reductase